MSSSGRQVVRSTVKQSSGQSRPTFGVESLGLVLLVSPIFFFLGFGIKTCQNTPQGAGAGFLDVILIGAPLGLALTFLSIPVLLIIVRLGGETMRRRTMPTPWLLLSVAILAPVIGFVVATPMSSCSFNL